MRKIFSAALFIGISIYNIANTLSMEKETIESKVEGISITPLGTPVNELSLFRQQGLIRLTLEEAIPLNCQKREELIALLKGTPLTLVKTDANQVLKKDVGYTFPTTAPWCLLVAAYIRSLPLRPNLGDWGCGHGFFSQLALISGANPYAFDSSNAAANEANRLLWNTRSYLPEGLNIKELYKASWTSVVNPGENFMERKNHINVSFNVVHHLLPEQSDKFLKKLFINTEEGGFAILCADTPFGSRGGGNVILDFYNEGVKLGLKYAGYGVYSRSTITFLDNLTSNNYLDRKAYRPTKQDRKNKKFEMGVTYKGIFPVITKEDTADNGRIRC